MSGILGVFTTGELPERVSLERMVAGLAARGGERSTLWCGAGAALAVSRYEWESEAGFSGPVLELE
jgi:asparagine synthetase B (glutamine-hydrolysing)